MAFTEIAHNYDQKVIDKFYIGFSRYFRRTLDTGAPTVQGLENLLSIPADTSVVLVSTHKSHLDYVVVPWILKHHQTPKGDRPLAIAAGDNLFKRIAKWDFNKILRKAGGYKIIRNPEPSKKLSTTKTLLKYTAERMGEGDWFLIFPEKGRSYTGEVLPFDPAALDIFQKAEKHAGRQVFYVPLSISYERVPEDRWFTSFAKYKSSQSSFKKLLYYALDWPLIAAQQYSGVGNRPIGNITVRFGKPITNAENGLLHKEAFAEKLENECKSLVTAFSTNIICASFLQGNPENVGFNIVKVYDLLKQRGALAENLKFDEIVPRAARFLDAPFRRFFQTGLAYGFARKDIMEYYNNCIAHYFKS